MSDTAACAPERICRTNNNRIADFISKSYCRFQFIKNTAFRNRLMDFIHRALEQLTIFRMLDSME